MRVEIEDFRPFAKNTLKGFVTVALPEVGLRIKECLWHEKNGRQWIGFPARSYKSRDGRDVWVNLIEFLEGFDRNSFQDTVMAAIKRKFPNAGRSPEAAPATAPATGVQRAAPRRDPRQEVARQINARAPAELDDSLPW
jgi:hypothetical protein